MDFHAVVAKSAANAAPPLRRPILLLLAARSVFRASSTRSWRPATGASCRSTVRARSRSAASTSMSAAPTRKSARYAGWRIAQRQGFRALWAKMHNAPITRRRTCPTVRSTRSSARSMSSASRSGPTATSPTSASCSTAPAPRSSSASRAARCSARQPMLLIPITVTAGTETSVELRNAWQRAWAQFRTSQSPIDYVRVSGMGVDPLLVNAAQTARPGAAGGATCSTCTARPTSWSPRSSCSAPIPADRRARRFIGRHGPDNEIVGGFTLTAPNSDAIPAMMARGRAAHGRSCSRRRSPPASCQRDPSLNLPPPPVLPSCRGSAGRRPAAATNAYPGPGQRQERHRLQFRDGASAHHARSRIGDAAADQSRAAPAMCWSTITATSRSWRAALSARGWIGRVRGDRDQDPVVVRQAAGSAAAAAAARRRRRRRSRRRSQSAARARRMKQGPDQIALPLDWPQSDGDARFIVTDANREAFDHFRNWSMWPVKATILTGPRRSGRTLLARSFVERVGGRLFDEAEQPRRGGAVPRLEPGAGYRPSAGHDRRPAAAGVDAATARPARRGWRSRR